MSLFIKSLEVGQMQANCYLVWQGSNVIIIDPGDDAEYIIQKIADFELTPVAIIATHGHVDHTMAVLELKFAYNIPFYMHKADEFLLKRIEKTAEHFLNYDPGPPPKVDVFLKENSEVTIGDLNFKVIGVEGHTPGSVCLYFEKDQRVFVGDLLFADGSIGRADFSYSDILKLHDSIERIKNLKEGTTVYPGHGEDFTISHKRSSR